MWLNLFDSQGKSSFLKCIVSLSEKSAEGAGRIVSIGGPQTPAEKLLLDPNWVEDTVIHDSDNVNRFDYNEKPTTRIWSGEVQIGKLTLHMWDSPGKETTLRTALLYTKRADAIFIVYDVCNAQSFLGLEALIIDIVRNGE